MVQLRDLTATVKIDTRTAIKNVERLDKAIDDAADAYRQAAKEADRLEKEAIAAGKESTKASRDAAKHAKRAERGLKALQKERRDEIRLIKKAVAEEERAAKKHAAAIRQREKAVERANKSRKDAIRDMRAQTADAGRAMVELGAKVAAGLAAASTGIVTLTKNWADQGKELDINARRFDVGRQELQELSGAARLAGAPFDELVDGIKELRIRLAEAKEDGINPAAESLEELGLNAKDFDGRSITDSFQLIASRLKTLSKEADRGKILSEILGEEAGIRLAPLLDEGPEKIARLTKRFKELGGIIGGETVDEMIAFRREWEEATIMVESFARLVAGDLAPEVKKLIESFKEWVKANNGLNRQRIVDLLKRILAVTKDIVPVLLKMAEGSLSVIEALGGVEQALQILIGTVAAFKIASAGAFGPWAAAAVAFIALLDTVKAKQDQLDQSQDSAIKRAIKAPRISDAERGALAGTERGGRVSALEEVRAANVAKIKGLGGPGIAARTRIVDRNRSIDEVGGAEDAAEQAVLDRQRDEAIRLAEENKEIDKRIAREIAQLREEGFGDQGPQAPDASGFFDVDADKRARFQELVTRRRQSQGKLSKADAAELKALRGELNVIEPKKIGDGKKGKKKKEDKRSIQDLIGIGLPEGAGIKTIAESQPKSLGTVVNNFSITNQIGVPSFRVEIAAAPGATPRKQAEAVVEAFGSGFSTVIRQAQRASAGQVLG